MFGWEVILEIFLLAYIFYFLNCLLILPLALQFWETSKLRYIKEINPWILILRLKKDGNNDKENKYCENILDIICFVMIILYLLSFGLYNIFPELFEILNIICFIVLPFIKFFIIFASTWLFGLRIRYCSCCCDSLQDNEIKTLLSFDKFERQNLNHEPSELYQDLEPVRLLMYDEKKDRFFLCWKWIISLVGLLLCIFCYSIGYKNFIIFIYLLIFFVLLFPISLSVPNPLYCSRNIGECFILSCNCDCECCNTKIVSDVDKKFRGLKYWIYIIIFLVNIFILLLLFFAIIINDYEYESIDKRLGLKDDFDKIIIEDLTEQNFARNSVKIPMCFTNIHHLNFIQLITLAQAPYLNNGNEITIAKDSYYKDTIFKDLTIEKMEFLTKENGNIVLLRTDIKFPNSDKK